MHDVVEWFTAELEHAVIDTRAERAKERNFRASAGVEARVRFLPRAEPLLVKPRAGRDVELHPGDGDRRLQQRVPHARAEGGGRLIDRFVGGRELELEPDDEQADAERQALGRAVRGRVGAAEKHGGVGKRGSRRQKHERGSGGDVAHIE